MTLDLRGLCPLLQVYDMPTALRFYRDLLGFEVIGAAPNPPSTPDGFGWVWLRHGPTELMLNTAYDPEAKRPAQPEPARVAHHDDTALFIGTPDVEAVYRRLTTQGIALDPPKVAPYGMRQLSLKDPDGFTLCFQWPAESA